VVVGEIVWTLESFYHLPRTDIRDKVVAILNTPGLEGGEDPANRTTLTIRSFQSLIGKHRLLGHWCFPYRSFEFLVPPSRHGSLLSSHILPLMLRGA